MDHWSNGCARSRVRRAGTNPLSDDVHILVESIILQISFITSLSPKDLGILYTALQAFSSVHGPVSRIFSVEGSSVKYWQITAGSIHQQANFGAAKNKTVRTTDCQFLYNLPVSLP